MIVEATDASRVTQYLQKAQQIKELAKQRLTESQVPESIMIFFTTDRAWVAPALPEGVVKDIIQQTGAEAIIVVMGTKAIQYSNPEGLQSMQELIAQEYGGEKLEDIPYLQNALVVVLQIKHDATYNWMVPFSRVGDKTIQFGQEESGTWDADSVGGTVQGNVPDYFEGM